MNPYIILAVLVWGFGLGGVGYFKGGADNEATHVAAQLLQVKADAEAARTLAMAEQKARMLARELEDAANADPIIVPECLGVDRVRRLRIQ